MGDPHRHLDRSLVAVGGATGAAVRYGVLQTWPVGFGFPWPVFAVNVAGSFVIGLLVRFAWRNPAVRRRVAAGMCVGFCGGLTTFSTLALEVAGFIETQSVVSASVYATASVGSAIVACAAGMKSASALRSEQAS